MTESNAFNLLLEELKMIKHTLNGMEQHLDVRFTEAEKRMDTRFAETEQRMDTRFAETEQKMDARFAETEQKMDARFAETEQKIDTRFVSLEKRMDTLEAKVDRNHEATLEFYKNQREFNTKISDQILLISGQLEMHNNQLAINTSRLKQFH